MKVRCALFSGSMTGLAVFLFVVLPFTAQADAQTTIVVDGQYGDWDLAKDCSTPMRSDRRGTREVSPNVYLRYDNITNTVFVLVLQKDSMQQDGKGKPVVNIYTLGQNIPVDSGESNISGKASNFSWVMDGSNCVGWEGAFQLSSGAYDCNTENTYSSKSQERKRASEVEVLDTDGFFFKSDK